MAGGDRRICKCCLKLFRPDPRNRHHQRYCSVPACRAASKAASQARWLAVAENQGYFRGPVNCSGPGSLNRFSASLSGVLPGLGCHADGQRVEVGLIGCVAVKARVGPAAIVQQSLRTPTGPFSENCFIIGIHGLGCGWRSTR